MTMPKILILNGPNLNLLGTREPDIYGSDTLADIEAQCEDHAKSLNVEIDFRQSNHEGVLVDWIQDARTNGTDAIMINAAAYTHTSVAIHDALKAVCLPVAEIHLSEPKERETFRHFSFIEPVASIHISGKGPAGYVEALEKLCKAL